MIKETLLILSEDKPAFEAACEKASVMATIQPTYKDKQFLKYEIQAANIFQVFLAGKYFGIQSVFDIQNKLLK